MFMQSLMSLFYSILNAPVTKISVPRAYLDEIAQFLLYGSALLFDVGSDLRAELGVVVVSVP